MPLLPGAHCTVMYSIHFLSGPDFRISDSILTKAKICIKLRKHGSSSFSHPANCAYFDLKSKLLPGAHCTVMNFINFLSGSDFRSDFIFTKVYKIYKLVVEIW